LHMALPPGIPTHELSTTKNQSRLDHVFVSGNLTQRVIKCTASPTNRIASTDHFPLLTELNLECSQSPLIIRRNFKEVDWEGVGCALEQRLANLSISRIHSIEVLESRVQDLTEAIDAAIDRTVPSVEITSYSKRWWSKKLRRLRKHSNNLRNRHTRHKTNPIPGLEEEWKKAEKEYKDEIQNAKQTCWDEFIDKADGDDLWTAHKYLNSDITD
ncbi:hypothetical protein BDV93DRAFT_421059, partial [Ceratobasidium sp. AG-I]